MQGRTGSKRDVRLFRNFAIATQHLKRLTRRPRGGSWGVAEGEGEREKGEKSHFPSLPFLPTLSSLTAVYPPAQVYLRPTIRPDCMRPWRETGGLVISVPVSKMKLPFASHIICVEHPSLPCHGLAKQNDRARAAPNRSPSLPPINSGSKKPGRASYIPRLPHTPAPACTTSELKYWL